MVRIAEYGREEFIKERFVYRNGEHLLSSGPTGAGKTSLHFDLLHEVATPKLPAVFFYMKPRDKTLDEGGKLLKAKQIPNWPPSFWQTHVMKPRAYLLRPPTTFNPDVDEIRQYHVFRRAMLHCYRKGNFIVDADELYYLMDLGLQREAIAMWSRARAMGTGFWGGVQKPSHIPLWGYNNSEHLLLNNDPDMRNIRKYGEFGGINPGLIEEIVPSLPDYWNLYLRRRGRVAAIIRDK